MTAKLLFDPSYAPMRYACGVSGSGSNYDKIFERNPSSKHIVFSNSPGCSGIEKAERRHVPVAVLDSQKYFHEMCRLEKVPRYGHERDGYDMAMMTLVEQSLNARPDLICLAGYDLWIGNWMVERYYPTILNVHPGDARKYIGLGWTPTAKAILAGESSVKSTVFIVDQSDDGGPILIQSRPLLLSKWDNELREIRRFAEKTGAKTLNTFRMAAENEGNNLYALFKEISSKIQEALKVEGDWMIYPFAVHELIAKGRVAIEGRTLYIDGVMMPEEGWQVDKYGFADDIS